MSDRGNRRRGMAFNYQAPTYQDAVQLSERRGRSFDSIFKEEIKFFKAKAGDNQIRILPPTWEGHKHYSLEIKVHRDVGPDKGQYLCLNQDRSPEPGQCPVCAERAQLVHTIRTQADKEEVDKMRASTSGAIFLIDRFRQRETDIGPLVWQISTRTDTEILSQSLIKSSHMYLPIVHPLEGYDVEFTRVGEGIMTRYSGFRVARSPSPVSDNPDQMQRWMDYLDDHPLPEMLNFYPAEHIRRVWGGQSPAQRQEDGERVERTPEPVGRASRTMDREIRQEDLPPATGQPWEGKDEIRVERPAERPADPPPPRARVEGATSIHERMKQRLSEV